jgi:hypothetical protein
MEKTTRSSLGITALLSGTTVAMLVLIPALIAAWPTILSKMQDDYPERVKDGDTMYMLLSPMLDRREIHKRTPPNKIMEKSMTIGLRSMVDRIVNPVLTPVRKIQDVTSDTLDTITVAIQKGITFPMRGLFKLGTRLTDTLNKVFASVTNVGVKIGQAIQGGLNAMIAGTVVGLHMQTTIYNLAISGIKFFMWIVEVGGIAVTVAGTLMMLSLFTIIPGIILVTFGGILTNIAVSSENVLRFA